MAKDEDLFDDGDGVMAVPTMRGTANIDAEDYADASDPGGFLDDELMEVPPPKQSGAAPATDVEGTSDFDMLDDAPGPGMTQTTYGAHPWQIGAGGGYRPFSQQTTDMSDLAGEPMTSPTLDVRAVKSDPVVPVPAFRPSERNEMPSNEEVDPLTVYDRQSYEYNDSPGNVIGSGIFDMEEGATFRPRDGIFANQYALPSYIADEDADGVQQSQMWDVVADNWRVTQVNASGVPLSRATRSLRATPAPFDHPAGLRPEVTGPRSHIEAFGRRAAKSVLEEARMIQDRRARSAFLAHATSSLGPKMAARAKSVADGLVKLGYPADVAIEDALAHCVMHALMRDFEDRRTNGGGLPRVDKMAAGMRSKQAEVRKAAADHVQPLASDPKKLQADLGAFYASRSALGLGQVDSAASSSPAAANLARPASASSPTLFTPRNVMIGVAVLGLGYLAATQTQAGRQVTSNVAAGFRSVVGGHRSRRRK